MGRVSMGRGLYLIEALEGTEVLVGRLDVGAGEGVVGEG